jgi:hypothetical protein
LSGANWHRVTNEQNKTAQQTSGSKGTTKIGATVRSTHKHTPRSLGKAGFVDKSEQVSA